MRSCLRRIGGLFTALCALALVAAPTAGAALSSGYVPSGVSEPAPSGAADGFGGTMVKAGDLVLVGVPKANGGEGAIVFVNPVSGETRRIDAPLEPSHVGPPNFRSTNFGASVAVIPDIGKCQSPPAKRGGDCTPSSTPDGIPDYLVGAPGADINSTTGRDMGRVYLYDGATDGLLKRIQIGPPPASSADPVPGAPAAGTPDFGRTVSSASGLPPCAGSGGMGACPPVGARVAKGDIDGGQTPDIVIGAPQYRETEDSNPACLGQAICEPTGRVYVLKGEDLTGAGPAVYADASHLVFDGPILYPYPEETSSPPTFGGSVSPLGDVGSCDTTDVVGSICPADKVRNSPDGVPDLLVSGTGVDGPTVDDVGAAFVVDGASSTILETLDLPTEQQAAAFGAFGGGEPAAGDLAGSALPDIYVGAPGYDDAFDAQGRGFVFTGDATAPATQLIGLANDPTPAAGEGFGAVVAPAGNIVADAPGELLIGESGAGAGDVHVYSACANAILQTIGAPDGAAGFGNSVVSLGDVDGDGFVDFAVGAPGTAGNAGRVYIMRSNGAPGPAFAGCTPDPPPGGGGGGGGGGSTGGTGGTGGSTGGGSTSTNPPKQGKAVSVLTKRKIAFAANKKKVKVAAFVKFRGTLRASKRKRSCQGKQKVAIQRFQTDAGAGFWTTIDVALTNRKGSFVASTAVAPAQKFFYRAHVNQTKRCAVANSKRIAVTATP